MLRYYNNLMEGKIYELRDSSNVKSEYRCISASIEFEALLERVSDQYTLTAHGTQINPDGTIEWDYSTSVYFNEQKQKR